MAGGVFCGYKPSNATREIVIIRTKQLLLALFGLSLAGCVGPAPGRPALQAREVVEVARWLVSSGSEQLGELVRFEIRDPSGPVAFFRVLDRSGRWVGHADVTGRFSRRVPFQEEEEDLGVWSLEQGCGLLFERKGGVTLTAQKVGAADAVFRRAR